MDLDSHGVALVIVDLDLVSHGEDVDSVDVDSVDVDLADVALADVDLVDAVDSVDAVDMVVDAMEDMVETMVVMVDLLHSHLKAVINHNLLQAVINNHHNHQLLTSLTLTLKSVVKSHMGIIVLH